MFRALILVILLFVLPGMTNADLSQWGFFGHKLINRMAVFTLPSDMIKFYKDNIEYITEHAIDPDKRRYATRHEAVRHYIDIDHWGDYPFPELPRKWIDALIINSGIYHIREGLDTLSVLNLTSENNFFIGQDTIDYETYKVFFANQILPQYYEKVWDLDCAVLQTCFPTFRCDSLDRIIVLDRFSEHGIIPYHLIRMQSRLTEAMEANNPDQILRLSTDLGHYLADAHVPLHVTANYNGQLTGQDGIHAFWESRIPELFAEANFDFIVGQAEYIVNPAAFYWSIILSSHSFVDKILQTEKQLSKTFKADRQYCFDERLDQAVRTQCKEYAAAFDQEMDGMVEQRMRAAIHAIGSAWYTAWADAGQPVLSKDLMSFDAKNYASEQDLENKYKKGKVFGRRHQ